MIRNYFKVAIRNLTRNKIYSSINILGLALGMATAIFIFLWVQDERAYNRFHDNGKSIYRLMENQYWGDVRTSDVVPFFLSTSLRDDYPEVLGATMLTWPNSTLVTVGDKSLKKAGLYSNPDLFRIFTFPVIEGNTDKLSVPTSVVLTESMAKSLFPDGNAVGKSINIGGNKEFEVVAIVRDIPDNSSVKFDFVLSSVEFVNNNEWVRHWGNHSFSGYLQLAEGTDVPAFEKKIKNYLKSKHENSQEEVFLQAFEDTYLYSNFKNGFQDGGRIEYVRLFTAVAILILIIACINFMNLATARSAKRAREVGVRKVVGAERKYLAAQFIGESVMIALIALTLSLVLVQLFLPFFNSLTDKTIRINLGDPQFLGLAILLAIGTGVIAGSYPAFFLSAMRPVHVLKAGFKTGYAGGLLRKGLVVFQFSISIVLIIGTVVIHRQVSYLKNKDLGVDQENVLYVSLEGNLETKFDLIKEELKNMPGISSVTRSSNKPNQVYSTSTDPVWEGKPEGLTVTFVGMSVDYDFLTTTGIELLDGRDFSPAFGLDSLSYIINETAARIMGMKSPVGEKLQFWNGAGHIVGVVKDFHVQSLHHPIQPVIMQFQPLNTSYMLLQTQSGQTAAAINSLTTTLKKHNGAYPVEFKFLDEDFGRLYKSEMVIGKLSNSFACLAIFIACLGLFGLAAFTAEQRKREIGIRKVVGASVTNIVRMLSKDFLKLVAIASILSFPLAWWLMNDWLKKFAYPVSVSWWIFLVAAVTALAIALLTISFQAIRAAIANPVQSLRSE